MRIFKYISDNDSEIVIDSIFKENLIKFSKAKEFNDPFELKPHFTGIFNDVLMENFKSQNTQINGLFKVIANSQFLLDELNKSYSLGIEKFGILSLTTKKDNLLMWSHYANSHKGLVIEFDLNNDFFNTQIDAEFFCGKLHKIEYSEKKTKWEISRF